MDVIFKCPNCEQELAVDDSGVGTEIECPACSEKIMIPEAEQAPAGSPPPPDALKGPMNAIASSAGAKEEKHFTVPVHSQPTEKLIEKPLPPLEAAAKEGSRNLRVKTIKRGDCMEVGHDNFDKVVTKFLDEIGEGNIVSINTVNYSHTDHGSEKVIGDFGVLIIYKG